MKKNIFILALVAMFVSANFMAQTPEKSSKKVTTKHEQKDCSKDEKKDCTKSDKKACCEKKAETKNK